METMNINLITEDETYNMDVKVNVLERAMELAEVDSVEDVIKTAIAELITNRKREGFMKLKGAVEFYDDYDYKAMRGKAGT